MGATAAVAAKTTSKPRSFITLDALRGVAALPVVYLHTARIFGPPFLFAHAYLAVDFFLLLSGFVMTYVYQERLDAGWPTLSFLKARIFRLYPLYLAGLLLGATFIILRSRFGKVHVPGRIFTELLLLAFFFLPLPPNPWMSSASKAMYPFDTPAWSLAFELVANLLHALVLRRRTLILLGSFVAAMSVVLLWLTLHQGTIDKGSDRSYYLFGLVRTLFSYPGGVLLYMLWSRNKLRLRLPAPVLALLLLSLLAIRVPAAWNGLYEWLTVTFIFPLLLCAGATVQPADSLVRLSTWLGALSYPIYILHVPLFDFFEQVWVHIAGRRIEQDAPWPGILFLAVLIPVAYWIGQTYDPEARKLLHTRLLPSRSRKAYYKEPQGS